VKAGASYGPNTQYHDEPDAHVVRATIAGGDIQWRYHYWDLQSYCQKIERTYHFQKVN